MSIKDDLREYAHSKGLNKYNDVKQKIVKEIKEEIAGCEKEVTVSWEVMVMMIHLQFHWSKM